MINKNILKQVHEHGRMNESEVYDAYKIFFGTLVSESRLKIIHLLRRGRKNVREIMSEFEMDQTSVSHDLARLKQCGFVNCRADGKFRYYSLNEKTIKPLMALIEKHMADYCIHILHGMKGGNEHGKH
ncbi:MAG TPA: metalloregulator ArsR/SmtB family transcription factor [Candidatus Nanoarchaeia archaeon]|nr:metalloregulator ArsR/SmtB family transcription factor [Candidatus Nanoarchaeia archaeon]